MPQYLRLDRKGHEGWILAEGLQRLGEFHPDTMTFSGFRDAASTSIAAEIASRVLRQWHGSRSGESTAAVMVSLTADGRGFSFAVPSGLWHALLLELAQRIHAATRSLRHFQPEPAA